MEKMKNVYWKSTYRKLLYLLLCIGSVGISVLLCSCPNPLGSIDFDEECHYIGTINSDGFDSSYTFISVMINGRAVSDVKYNINDSTAKRFSTHKTALHME